MHAIEHTHTISLPCPSLAVSEKKIKLKRKVIAVTKILTDFSIPLTVLTQRLQASQSTTSADSHLELPIDSSESQHKGIRYDSKSQGYLSLLRHIQWVIRGYADYGHMKKKFNLS